MKKLFAALRSAQKRVAIVAIVAAAIVVPASLYAWGPDRPTFTMAHPADHVTFNSITDNPNYGDERNFVTVKDPATGNYVDTVNVEQGKEYEVRVLVHNNAGANLNLVALNTTLKTAITTTTGKQNAITSYVSADNASPRSVYDDAFFKSAKDFNLTYVPDSVRAYNNGYAAGGTGKQLSDNMFTQTGVKLGYAQEGDGKIPGCFQYINYVYFKVKPQFAPTPDFTVAKSVSKKGQNDWKETVSAEPGEIVDYRVRYQNTGDIQQDNVVVKDQLPAHMSYVPGTSKLYTSSNPNGKQLSDGIVTSQGVNIGSFAPGGAGYVVFQAKVGEKSELECGNNKLTNTASVTTDYGTKDDTADVTVPKECQEQPEYKCTALAVSKLSDTKFNFETGYTVKGGTFKSVSYTIRNEAGSVVATVNGTPNAVEYTQTTPGKYTVQATVTFTVNGQDVTATGEACKKAFEVPTPPKDIQVCELATKKIITIKESDFDATKHSKNLDDCKETPVKIQVCELSTKKVITINEADFDATKHSKDLNDCKAPGEIIVCDLTTKEVITIKEDQFDASKHSKDLNDCKAPEEHCPIPGKENLPKDSADCKETCPVPGKEHMPKDSPECKETPVTPTELPQTGAGDGILTIAGLATFALIAGYAVTGRRTLG